jgi:hypothetical protein
MDRNRLWMRRLAADLTELGAAPSNPSDEFKRKYCAEDVPEEKLRAAAKLAWIALDAITQDSPTAWKPVTVADDAIRELRDLSKAHIIETLLQHVFVLRVLPNWSVERLKSSLLKIDARFQAVPLDAIEKVVGGIRPSKKGRGAQGIVRAAAMLAEDAGIEVRSERDSDETIAKRFRVAYERVFGETFAESQRKVASVRIVRGRVRPRKARTKGRPTSE